MSEMRSAADASGVSLLRLFTSARPMENFNFRAHGQFDKWRRMFLWANGSRWLGDFIFLEDVLDSSEKSKVNRNQQGAWNEAPIILAEFAGKI